MINKNLIPDEIRTWVGPFGDENKYVDSGKTTLDLVRKYYDFTNTDVTLDAGCGCGRLTIHLLDLLKKDAVYFGFDICPEHIKWCKEHIESIHSNFQFYHLDVKKKAYNPNGKYNISETKLPYGDNSIDFIIAHSLFTHMLSDEFEYYISELSRVLKKGGSIYASYYLYNDDRKKGISVNTACLNFIYKINNCYTFDNINPEEAIAQIEKNVLKVYHKNNLEVSVPIFYSKWSENKEFEQDFIIAKKI
jgi:SAM-dependent methyltransferase